MKAGILGVVDGGTDSIESFHRTREQDGTTFSRSLQVRGTTNLRDGRRVSYGECALEKVESKEKVSIGDDGDIRVTESGERTSSYTEFIYVPDTLAVVSSGDGEFAFSLIEEATHGASVTRARIDLNGFAQEYYTAEEVDPWQVGFYGNLGNAEKGTVYGEDVFDDDEIGDVLERSQLNQLGLRYPVNGTDIKMTMAESGYVEIYQPSNYEEKEYVQYLVDEILDFAEKPSV